MSDMAGSVYMQRIGEYGRLGNQMFQFAVGYAASKKLGRDLHIPHKCDLLRVFPGIANYDFIKADERLWSPHYEIEEKHFHYDESVFTNDYWQNEHLPVSLVGYFQSQRYFLEYSDEIWQIFRTSLDKDVYQWAKDTLDKRGLEYNIFVHVRLGDYLKKPDHHPVCSDGYYEKALNEALDYFGREETGVFLCSDEYNKAMKKMPTEIDITKSGSTSDAQDLALMMMCDGAIIANSSFSWWGAFLTGSHHVWAPERWFGSKLPHNTKDLLPKDWRVVS